MVCRDWNYLGDVDQADEAVSEFVVPTTEVTLLFEESLVETVQDFSERVTTDLPLDAGAVVARLQKQT